MYREESWSEGFYVDNHKKYKCKDCGREFICGEKLLDNCPPGFPVCPYCGQDSVECVAWTDDDKLQQIASDMGCLAIYVDEEGMTSCW